MKTETNSVNHAQDNVKHAYRAQFNALHVIHRLIESKDMIA